MRLARTIYLMLSAVFIIASQSLAAQEPTRFRSQPGTRWIERFEPNLLYGVRNGDTLLVNWIPSYLLQEWSWLPGEPPRVRVRTLNLLYGGDFRDSVTFTINPSGALLAVFDSGIAEGESFASTSSHAYRISRVIDTLNTRVAVIVSEGREETRFGESPRLITRARRVDMAGPARRTWWFDLRAGRLIALRETRDLLGTVTFLKELGGVSAMDTLPGVWRSTLLWREVSRERAELLSHIVSSEVEYSLVAQSHLGEGYHRAYRAPDTVISVFLHHNSMTAARTVFHDGQVISHEWEQAIGVSSRGGVLSVSGHMRADTIPLLPPPSVAAWAVAEPGMEEHLVPALRTLPAKPKRRYRFAIYRPTEARWTVASIQFVPLNCRVQDIVISMTGVLFNDESGGQPTLLAFSDDGKMVMARTSEDGRWRVRSAALGSYLAEYADVQLMALAGISDPSVSRDWGPNNCRG